MNPSLMRERIAPDDRLVRLHVEADDTRKHLARRIELSCINTRLERQPICAHAERHHNLFKRRIACPLANTVYSALNLSCSCFDCCQTVCNSQTQIVVTVNTDDDVAISDNSLAYLLDEMRVLHRRRIANRVRNIQH